MISITEEGQEVRIPWGDFVLVSLDRENPMNPHAKRHVAYVRYNGLSNGVADLEMGEYDGRKDRQEGRLLHFPAEESSLNYRIDTSGHRVIFRNVMVTPTAFIATDATERQTAIRD